MGCKTQRAKKICRSQRSKTLLWRVRGKQHCQPNSSTALVSSRLRKEWHPIAAKKELLKSKQQTRVCVCVCGHFPSIMAHAYAQHHSATAAFQRKKTKFNCSRSFHRFSRQIISGLCPLAPTLCPSCSLWPIITCHSFDLFISSSLGWVEAKRNPLISGSWLCSLRGELWSVGGKQQRKLAGRSYSNPPHTSHEEGQRQGGLTVIISVCQKTSCTKTLLWCLEGPQSHNQQHWEYT